MRLRMALVLGLLVLSVQGASKAADVPSSCGGSWSVQASCVIAFKGLPITVKAFADPGAGPAAVVVVTLQGPNTPVPCTVGCEPALLGCAEAHTTGVKGCERSIDLTTTSIDSGLFLTCRVRGLDHGTYACSSGPQP